MDSRVSVIQLIIPQICNENALNQVITTTALAVAGIALVSACTGYYWFRCRSRRCSHRAHSKNGAPTLLTGDSSIKHLVPLLEKIPISPDTYNFRFGLPSADHVLGLPTGQHVVIYATIAGEPVKRKYTPVTSDEDRGHFDLVIKVYRSGVNDRFPDGGKMTQHVDNMEIGDIIPVSGPIGRMTYRGNGSFTMVNKKTKEKRTSSYRKVGMIAGGSGIAPMLQLIEAIIRDPDDKTIMNLLFANQTEKDILLRDRLDHLANHYPERLKVWYTLDRADKEWQYSVGFVNSDMISQYLPPAADDTLILICGPPAMIKLACNPNLDKLGYKEHHRFKY